MKKTCREQSSTYKIGAVLFWEGAALLVDVLVDHPLHLAPSGLENCNLSDIWKRNYIANRLPALGVVYLAINSSNKKCIVSSERFSKSSDFLIKKLTFDVAPAHVLVVHLHRLFHVLGNRTIRTKSNENWATGK